jgi:hypothetical protein
MSAICAGSMSLYARPGPTSNIGYADGIDRHRLRCLLVERLLSNLIRNGAFTPVTSFLFRRFHPHGFKISVINPSQEFE